MRLIFLFFALGLGAMGPARDAPPPDAPTPDPGARSVPERDPQPARNPARLPPVAQDPALNAAPADPAPTPDLRIVDAADSAPADFLWQARPVVVFSDTPDDPAFVEQIAALRRDARQLALRDVVVVTDADPAGNSAWRRALRPRGFSLVVIDKDGQVKIRRPSPWDVREIGRAIDRLPLRRQEIGRGAPLR